MYSNEVREVIYCNDIFAQSAGDKRGFKLKHPICQDVVSFCLVPRCRSFEHILEN